CRGHQQTADIVEVIGKTGNQGRGLLAEITDRLARVLHRQGNDDNRQGGDGKADQVFLLQHGLLLLQADLRRRTCHSAKPIATKVTSNGTKTILRNFRRLPSDSISASSERRTSRNSLRISA